MIAQMPWRLKFYQSNKFPNLKQKPTLEIHLHLPWLRNPIFPRLSLIQIPTQPKVIP